MRLTSDIRSVPSLLVALAAVLGASVSAAAPANPAPQAPPLGQNWGTTSFTTLPPGFAAWNGVSGATTSSQTAAESSSPAGDATITATAPASGGAGGCYGYTMGGDARLTINTSGNATNGVNQLVAAITTIGQSNLRLSYDLINVLNNARTVGVVCQYRLGTTGGWTTMSGTGNPYVQTGGTAGAVTHAEIDLPAVAAGQPVVQIRWALWRGTESATSSAVAIDNIAVTTMGTGTPTISTVTLSGTSFAIDDPATVTVALTAPPAADTPATVQLSSGAFAASPISLTITAPASSAQAGVALTHAGTWTTTASAVSGCTGSGTSSSFTVSTSEAADGYDPPTSYYDAAHPGGVWYTGTTLKTALRNIIDNHTVRSYDAAKTALLLLEQDPNNSNNIVLLYDGTSVAKESSTWNREHQWPASRLVGSGTDSDLFNLRACDIDLNSQRGNLPYGIGTGYWDPNQGAVHRGDCARAMFYMATRYSTLTLVNGIPSDAEMGDLATLVQWHYQDPVAAAERRRNHLIYSSKDNPSYYQGNRNPYIDYPELVWAIWGTTPEDSRLTVGTAGTNGVSTVAVNLEARLGRFPPTRTVILNKTGTTPATYDVRISGNAASSAKGRGQIFMAGTQSRTIPVTIASTATVGLKTGTILVDNTGLTSAGAGCGSTDGDDTILVAADVLPCSDPFVDADGDKDVDLDDFAVFQRCLTGTGDPAGLYDQLPGACQCLDGTGTAGIPDRAIDASDLAVFLKCMATSGQGIPASSACDNG